MRHRIRTIVAVLFEALAGLRWQSRRHVTTALVLAILAVGAVAGWAWRSARTDPIYDEVRGAALLLRSDFASNVENLGGSYLRQFQGIEDGALVGDVTRAVSQGACWGFRVRISSDWLATGEGGVDVGEVQQYDAAMCTR